jgi:alpha-tubulin suppressor-like RCC1 family protein
MGRGLRAIILGMTVVAAVELGVGPGLAEGAPGETGSRALGSRIAAGVAGNHVCAVKEDGTVRCWGSNSSGQLGNGTGGAGQFSASPVTVGSNLTDAVAVAVGTAHSCALRATGSVACWGANSSGTLGDGTQTSRSSPVPVLNPDGSTLIGVVAIAAGSSHTCAVRVDGTARCWGSKSFGQLGTGGGAIVAPLNLTTAATVVGLSDAVSITAGSGHTCAVRASGAVSCWGSNALGELGNGNDDSSLHTVPADVPGLTDVIGVAAGGNHTCALRANGQVRCWGENLRGQVGDGTFALIRPSPTTVQGLGGAVALAVGQEYSCARRADGDVRCWGRGDGGQLGDLGTTDQATQDSVIVSRSCGLSGCTFTPLADATDIATGLQHACALQVDDRIRCWGTNTLGQLGDGDTNPQPNPQSLLYVMPTVVGSAGTIGGRSISAQLAETCTRRADGTAACWDSTLTPAALTGFTRTLTVAPGTSHKCALRADGLVQCVGRNQFGQIGNGAGGPFSPDVTDPAQGLVSGLTDVASIASGQDFTCALRVTGSVRCWGRNSFGQLGNDPTPGGFSATRFEASPVSVQGLGDAIAIAAGREHACAVRVGGAVICWGFNVFGQVGTAGTNTVVTTPFELPSISTAVAIAAGPDHTCAVLVNGTARCWGKNDIGQLGNGATTFTAGFITANPTPTTVVGLSDVVALATGGSGGSQTTRSNDFTCARRVGGTVQCWGANGAGQLGDNGTTPQPSPVTTVVRHAVTRLLNGITITLPVAVSGVTAISAGNVDGCALLASGQPFCWGSGVTFAESVDSFAFNIDPKVTLVVRDRIARVTALANCPKGDTVQINVSLTQGEVSGRGITVGACTGELERYELVVPAHGRVGFAPGAAVAEAEAIIRERGRLVDNQEWTRNVQLQ